MSSEHDNTPSDPLDGTDYEGIDRIEQQIPHRWPGFTKRVKRVREWAHLTARRIKREHPELSDREVQERVEEALDELYRDPSQSAD